MVVRRGKIEKLVKRKAETSSRRDTMSFVTELTSDWSIIVHGIRIYVRRNVLCCFSQTADSRLEISLAKYNKKSVAVKKNGSWRRIDHVETNECLMYKPTINTISRGREFNRCGYSTMRVYLVPLNLLERTYDEKCVWSRCIDNLDEIIRLLRWTRYRGNFRFRVNLQRECEFYFIVITIWENENDIYICLKVFLFQLDWTFGI